MKIVDKTFAEGDKVALVKTELTFNQKSDCLTDKDQNLIVTIEGDQDKYFNISTERWSFDNLQDLINVIKTASNLKIKQDEKI